MGKDKKENESGNVLSGTIVKGIAGFYYVDTGNAVYECKARGIFKKENKKPLVGDDVDIDISGETPVVCDIGERLNSFDRPPVANVQQLVLVSALKKPSPNFVVIDKFLTMAESKCVDILICFSKSDLVSHGYEEKVREIYGAYDIICADVRTHDGVKQLIPYLKGKKSALAGPSGVGKSTIMNAITDGKIAETGEVSEKTNRGRHTTRHVELFKLEFGGMLFDTPGFTSFDVPRDVSEDDLAYMFREFEPYLGQCRFTGCNHRDEPGCAVKKAVSDGYIPTERYESYISQLDEIRERQKRRYT